MNAAPLSDADLLARFHRARNRPKSSDLLGFEMIAVRQAAREVEVAFDAREEFTNPMGVIQGGFLSAMLDEALSIAGLVAAGMNLMMSTLEMKTSYLRPAKPGRLIATGRVVRLGRRIAFLEGEIRNAEGEICATATATALPTEFKRPAR